MKRVLLLLLISIVSFNTDAQFMRRKLKKRTAEAAVYGSVGYYGNPHWSVGANIQYLHGIGRKKQTFSIGMGIRANVFNTEKREYTTSSQYLSSINPGGADTMYMPEVQTNSLNGYVALKIHIKQSVDIFINTDIGGINFGDAKKTYFRSYETAPLPPGVEYRTEPYAFNLNMFAWESYGSLMSEIYGSFRLNKVMYWRLGFNYFRNEYKVDQNIPMNGKRFSQNHWMVMSGLAFDVRWKRTHAQSDRW
jgi:hypothetical protein